ncbi:hypothetical protein AGMMS4956_20210 [Bacteroidia bacterium]|nr:hypothetical protein AGMMS4956_20210 [Bacteroidia bacterium]
MSSPFNEQKYKGLLEGLEVSEVKLSELLNYEDNENFRIDSDFFKKEFVFLETAIKKTEWDYLGNLSKTIVNFGAYSLCNFIEFVDAGVPYLNVADIKENIINWENAKKIKKELSLGMLHKSLAIENQVLLTIAGTIGNASVAYKLPQFTNSNQAIANITTKDTLNPFYLSTYLNSRFGKSQTKKLTISSVQPNILLTQVKRIKIPVLPLHFQGQVEKMVKNAHSIREQSQQLYRQAEELLLKTIGLSDFKPSQEGKNIKSFKESFLSTGRLDAEYYQPKYEEIIEKIKEQPHELLVNLVSITKSIEPGSDFYDEVGVPFVRVADYNKFGMSAPDKYLSDIFCQANTELIENLKPKEETILFTKDGSVGNAYMLREDANFITSGAVLHLTVKNKKRILPEYLTLVLNSQVVQMQAERDAGGSIILHWRVSEIENVVVPVVDYSIQQQIAGLIEESFALRKESEQLLEEAKGMVEREIEK